MIKRGRGRPQSSNSKVAVRKRAQRARGKGEAITLERLVINDADSWIAILREDTDLVPEWITRNDTQAILRATVAWIDDECSEYRRERAEEKLRESCTRRVGQLEQEQPPELKDKGIRFPTPPEHGDYVPNRYVGIYSGREPLHNPPTKRDPGRHLSREEIEAWEEQNSELLAEGDDDSDGALNDGGDEGFDDAEDFDAEPYEGFEDEATDDDDED